MSTAKQIFGAFEQFNLVKTYLLTLFLTILLLYLLGWPGCIVAAAIGGFFIRRFSRAALIGFLAGLSAWGLLVGIHSALGGLAVLELFGAIAGLEAMGTVLAVVIVLIGGVLGLTGSLLGYAVFSLAEPYMVESIESVEG